ncbi:hypothetical protein BC828DRAFT_376251 [Blastocladiella britannica]|nr:hypothetical protein BC828DRAFT_376251 [Blastocladiella britannica]
MEQSPTTFAPADRIHAPGKLRSFFEHIRADGPPAPPPGPRKPGAFGPPPPLHPPSSDTQSQHGSNGGAGQSIHLQYERLIGKKPLSPRRLRESERADATRAALAATAPTPSGRRSRPGGDGPATNGRRATSYGGGGGTSGTPGGAWTPSGGGHPAAGAGSRSRKASGVSLAAPKLTSIVPRSRPLLGGSIPDLAANSPPRAGTSAKHGRRKSAAQTFDASAIPASVAYDNQEPYRYPQSQSPGAYSPTTTMAMVNTVAAPMTPVGLAPSTLSKIRATPTPTSRQIPVAAAKQPVAVQHNEGTVRSAKGAPAPKSAPKPQPAKKMPSASSSPPPPPPQHQQLQQPEPSPQSEEHAPPSMSELLTGQLAPCLHCGRTFATDRVARHSAVCPQNPDAPLAKRTPMDLTAQRKEQIAKENGVVPVKAAPRKRK